MPDKLIKTGFTCCFCRRNTAEEWIREDNMYYYRCPECIKEADPNDPNPCPKCGCKAHTPICNVVEYTDEGMEELRREVNNPFRPEIEQFECLNCGHRWYIPEFEEYLIKKVIK